LMTLFAFSLNSSEFGPFLSYVKGMGMLLETATQSRGRSDMCEKADAKYQYWLALSLLRQEAGPTILYWSTGMKSLEQLTRVVIRCDKWGFLYRPVERLLEVSFCSGQCDGFTSGITLMTRCL
jgi:hypothetical protein